MVQVAIVIVLAAMVNYLGFEHYRRWDLSRDKKYALSDKTKHFLEGMKGKARITVFFGSQNPITGDVQNLLTEYQYAAPRQDRRRICRPGTQPDQSEGAFR